MSNYFWKTDFYEDNAGGVSAIVRGSSGELVNAINNLELSSKPGDVLRAAVNGWPYADGYDLDDNNGMTMAETEAWLINAVERNNGGCAYIGYVTDKLVELYIDEMGASARALFCVEDG